MNDDPTSDTHAQLAEYLRLNPDATAIEAVGHVGADPSRWVDAVDDALAADTPHAALSAPADTDGRADTDPADVDPDGADTDTSEHAEEDPTPDRSTPGVQVEGSGAAPAEPTDDTDFNQHTDPEDGGVLVNDDTPATAERSGRTFYPATIRDGREWWVDWVLALPLDDDGAIEADATPTKQPIAPYRRGDATPVRWNFGLDDDDHPSTSFDTVARWNDRRLGLDLHAPERVISDTVGLGIIIPPDQNDRTITLLDWDDVRDPETEEIHPVAAGALEELDGYAEVSQSGKGIHQFVFGEIPGGLKKFIRHVDDEPFIGDDLPQIEMYQSGRLCAMTGEHVAGAGEDVTDGQDLIDRLCWEYGTAGNTATDTPSDPFAGDRTDADTDDTTPSHAAVGDAIRDAREYDGPAVEEWDTPDDRTVEYDAVLRARERSDELAGTANWELLGYAAGLGYRDGLDKETVLEDLREHPTPQYGYDDARARKEVRAVYRKAENGNYHPPTAERLAERGILPEDAVDTPEPVAPIALERLDALAADDARRRAARKRTPSTADARGRLRDAVFRELRAGNTTVIDAPTALGKSHGIATEPWGRRESTTGGAPVVHFHPTRDARDEAAEATADSAATGATLLGRKEASPVARGDHDRPEDPAAEDAPDQVVTIDGDDASDWFDRMCDDRGLPFSTALAIARDRNDQGLEELPPFGEEDPAVAQWNDLPRDDDGEPAVDVIHATHQFGYVPSLRTHTNVILDEQPDYRTELKQDRIRRMVNAYLRAIDAPTTHFEGFVMLARNDDARGDAAAERDALDDALDGDADLPTEWYAETDGAHALAPDLTRAIWNALRWEDPNENGLRSTKVYHEPPRFDADKEGYAAGTWLSVVLDDDHTVRTVRTTPDFSQARAVVGLDAHPSMPMWELNGPPGVTRDAVLDPTERRLWRRYERGLTVTQIGDAARPRSGPDALDWMNEERVRIIVDALREHYGDGFKTGLSTKQTEPALRRLLADVTGEPVDAVRDQTMHAGEEKSRNDFAEEDAGYVYGCMDPGDEMIVNALAELNLDATPSTVETEDGEEKREKGRTFDGSDADKAAAVLASVRENHVAQEAGRYAREPSDPESRATVYVDTNAAPAGFVDLEVPGVEWLASDLQRTIVDALTERPTATTRELADAAECTKEHVRDTLARLEEHGLVDREERAGAHGADVYRDAGADAGIVDLGETTNDPLIDSNRWSLAIVDRHAREEDAAPAGGPTSTPIDAVGAGDTPPDPVD